MDLITIYSLNFTIKSFDNLVISITQQLAFKMSKVILIFVALFATVQFSTAIENNLALENVIAPEIPLDADLSSATPDQALSMVEKMYRSTMVTVLKQKVIEVQRKIVSGENALPEAIDILKIALLSQPTNNITIRKAAENVFAKISPQLGKVAGSITSSLLEEMKDAQKPIN